MSFVYQRRVSALRISGAYQRRVSASRISVAYQRRVSASRISVAYQRRVSASRISVAYQRRVSASRISVAYQRRVSASGISIAYYSHVSSTTTSLTVFSVKFVFLPSQTELSSHVLSNYMSEATQLFFSQYILQSPNERVSFKVCNRLNNVMHLKQEMLLFQNSTSQDYTILCGDRHGIMVKCLVFVSSVW